MNKSELSGREFEQILEKSGFTRSDFIKFLSSEHKIERTLSWAHWLISQHPDDKKVPIKWVLMLKEMVGEKNFEKWAKGGVGFDDNNQGELLDEDPEAKEAADTIRKTLKKRPFGQTKGIFIGDDVFDTVEFEKRTKGSKLNDSSVDPIKAFRDAQYEKWLKLPKKPISGMEEIWEITTEHKTTRTVEDFLQERQEKEE